LLDASRWSFSANGKQLLGRYTAAVDAQRASTSAPEKAEK